EKIGAVHCGDPASNRAAVDPEQFRNGGLAQSLLEVMSQQHASLQSDQVRLHRVGESARCTIGRESVYAPPLRLPATTSEPGGTFSSAQGGKFSTAGNTRAPSPGPSAVHPRSRGDHAAEPGRQATKVGPPPLARGPPLRH